MRIYDIIRKKRDGESLTAQEIEFFIREYSRDNIKDYQASALLMAIYINGMNEEETVNLTRAMSSSGDSFNLDDIEGIKVDKHSTGGVGDSVTLILGPLVAACGVPFAKMSGRGLGHTGGTLDKLAGFKGIRLDLSDEEFKKNVNDIKIAIAGQTKNIAPADGKIYALRDVTATVDNISLIASSIMSKKLAIGSDAIVLDVKVGSGAFMKDIEMASDLAEEMVKIGRMNQRKTVAFLTNMDEPLGLAVGNDLELIEAIEILKGRGPEDLRELSLVLASEVLLLGGVAQTRDEARSQLEQAIASGAGLRKLKEFIGRQGGDLACIDDYSLFKEASYSLDVRARTSGYISEINAEEIGRAALILGAGRENIDSIIDLSAGILLAKKVDARVEAGEVLATIYSDRQEALAEAEEIIQRTMLITGDCRNNKKELILKLID